MDIIISNVPVPLLNKKTNNVCIMCIIARRLVNHSTRNVSNSGGIRRSELTLVFLCLPYYMRDKTLNFFGLKIIILLLYIITFKIEGH